MEYSGVTLHKIILDRQLSLTWLYSSWCTGIYKYLITWLNDLSAKASKYHPAALELGNRLCCTLSPEFQTRQTQKFGMTKDTNYSRK